MSGDREGVIISITAPAAVMAMPGHLGHIVGCAGVEAFTKTLASELGPRNIRVMALRLHAISGAIAAGSYLSQIFGPKGASMGISIEDWVGGAAKGPMLQWLPTLDEVGKMVAFLASRNACAMTATVINMTAGATLR